MPTRNGTGSEDKRPWTGLGAGHQTLGYISPMYGDGFGRKGGRGRRRRPWFDETGLLDWPCFEPVWWGPPPKPAWPTEEQEIEELKAQAERLQQELDE